MTSLYVSGERQLLRQPPSHFQFISASFGFSSTSRRLNILTCDEVGPVESGYEGKGDPTSRPLTILAILHGARDLETVLRNI